MFMSHIYRMHMFLILQFANKWQTYTLLPCTCSYSGSIQYTFKREPRGVDTNLDNILLPNKYVCEYKLTYVGVLDDIVNVSDHLAIMCHIALEHVPENNIQRREYNVCSHYYWSNDNKWSFYCKTDEMLQNIKTGHAAVNVLKENIVSILSTVRICLLPLNAIKILNSQVI